MRGIAVLLVVLEHATDVFPGGFVGVDVFFVISGFVITKLMLRELHLSGTVSLRAFYERRIRRLLPALTVVIIVTLCLSLLVLSPGLEQEKAAETAIASFFFLANVRYILEGGYFFLEADPFRHLWSLGVEEQFYLVYPVVILGVITLCKNSRLRFKATLVAVLALFSLFSLVGATALANGMMLPLATRLSFFGTPFRLWELMAGAVIAVVVDGRDLRLGKVPSLCGQLVGSALIVWPALTYGPFTLFPGISALPPVIGAVALILVGTSTRPAPNIAKWNLLVYLGDISYGLYLWHWPLIVFSRRLFPEVAVAPISAVLIAVVLSHISLRWIENPIRHRSDIAGSRTVRLFVLTATFVVIVAISLNVSSRSGLGLASGSQFESTPSVAATCNLSLDQLELAPDCTIDGRNETRLLLIGDSQAVALSDGFVEVAASLGASYRIAFGNSCPVHFRENQLWPGCQAIQRRIAMLTQEFSPTVVVVANASDLYVTRGGFGKPDARIPNEDGSFPDNYEEALKNWTSGLVQVMRADWLADRTVVYVQMPPVAPSRLPTLLQPRASATPFALSSSFDRNMVVEEEKKVLRSQPNVVILDPASVLCPNNLCTLATEEGPIYADKYHLNVRGARILAPELQRRIIDAQD